MTSATPMAENETTEATMARAPAPSKPISNYDHPTYAEMILTAIAGLNEKKGSSGKAIKKFIESKYEKLPPSHSALLRLHLRRLKKKGLILMVKHSYKLPKQQQQPSNPNSGHGPAKLGRGRPPKTKPKAALADGLPRTGRGRPPKPLAALGDGLLRRGRGRPPKPKPKPVGLGVGPAASDAVGLLKRPRGRPRKIEGLVVVGADLFSVGPKKRSGPSGRPRGMPKKAKVVGPDGAMSSGRPRGRPKKARVEGGADGPPSSGKPRGRPKKAKLVGPDGAMSSGRPRGRPRKAREEGADVTPSSGRPRGRPKKAKVAGPDGVTSSGKPRGRPKKVKVDGADVAKSKSPGRPRGRPRKVLAQ